MVLAWLGCALICVSRATVAAAQDGAVTQNGAVEPDAGVAQDAASAGPSTDPQAQATFNAPLALLAADWPFLGQKLSGASKVECFWTTERDGVHRRFVVTSERALLGGEPFGALVATVQLPPKGRATVQITVRGPSVEELAVTFEGELTVDLEHGKVEWLDDALSAAVRARGMDAARLNLLVPAAGLEGRVDFELALSGSRNTPVIDGTFRSEGLSWRGIPALPVQGTWRHGPQAGVTGGEANASHVAFVWGGETGPRIQIDARIPWKLDFTIGATERLTWVETGAHSLTLEATGLNAKVVKPFVELPRDVETELSVTATASGALSALVVDASLVGTLALSGTTSVPVKAAFASKGEAQRVTVAFGKLLKAEATLKADWLALRRGTQTWAQVPVDGGFSVDAALEEIAAYLPEGIASPKGRLEGSVKVRGTAGAPSFDGKIVARGAALTLTELNQRLDPLKMSLSFAGSRATFDVLSAQAGMGTITGKGAYTIGPVPGDAPADKKKNDNSWSGWDIVGGIELTLKNFPVIQQSLPLGTIDARVAVDVRDTPEMLDVSLTWHGARIKLTDQELPEARAIPANRNVRVLDWMGQSASNE
jgi:hypothetical protein